MGEPGQHSVDIERRSHHVAYRINSGFAYQETPCFCPARQPHSVLSTIATPPAAEVRDV